MKYLPILLEKEIKQLLKDKSVFLLAFLLPIMLVIIYGCAVRMDAKPVKLCIGHISSSKLERTIIDEFVHSEYYDVTVVNSFEEGRELLENNKVKAFIYLPSNISGRLANLRSMDVMVYLDGVESLLAATSSIYIQSTLNMAVNKLSPEIFGTRIKNITTRFWYNEANESVWFMMSGQYVSILTLMAIFLGSFVISREWDRKTIESLAITNASAFDIVLSKVIVYYVMAFWSMFITLGFGQLLYQIPISGSIVLLLCSLSVYVLEMVCLGVLISAVLKNQFLSVQLAVIIGFLPAVMLSGLIFDLRAVEWFIRIIGKMLPATYEIAALRVNILSNTQNAFLLQNIMMQLGFTLLFFLLAVRQVKKDSKC